MEGEELRSFYEIQCRREASFSDLIKFGRIYFNLCEIIAVFFSLEQQMARGENHVNEIVAVFCDFDIAKKRNEKEVGVCEDFDVFLIVSVYVRRRI